MVGISEVMEQIRKMKKQECIPVGCVPSAAVAVCWEVICQGGGVCPGGCLLRVGGVCPSVADGNKHTGYSLLIFFVHSSTESHIGKTFVDKFSPPNFPIKTLHCHGWFGHLICLLSQGHNSAILCLGLVLVLNLDTYTNLIMDLTE